MQSIQIQVFKIKREILFWGEKNTSNLRRKYWRKKCTFPMENRISDGNYDGNGIVGKQLVAEKNPTKFDGFSDGMGPSEIPSDWLTQAGGFRRDFWRTYSVGNPIGNRAWFSPNVVEIFLDISVGNGKNILKKFFKIFLFSKNVKETRKKLFCLQKMDSKFKKKIFFLSFKIEKEKVVLYACTNFFMYIW